MTIEKSKIQLLLLHVLAKEFDLLPNIPVVHPSIILNGKRTSQSQLSASLETGTCKLVHFPVLPLRVSQPGVRFHIVPGDPPYEIVGTMASAL